jgi:RNA polymerase sigma-70 factor (ECF subfamily)
LRQVKAVSILLGYQTLVGPKNQTIPPPGDTSQAIAAEGGLNAAIVAEMPRLRRHAVSLLYNVADAEDLIQDCLETALTKHATLKDPARLRPWMFAILNNLFLMRLRSGGRGGVTGSTEDFADSLAASAPPEDRAAALDLARAMGKLSFEHRQILLLINLEGYSYDAAAEVLAIPRGTVMSRLARARERLRALLEDRELRTVQD